MPEKKIDVVEEKRKHLKCPFCYNIQYQSNHKDTTSAWCERCGKCFSARWEEE